MWNVSSGEWCLSATLSQNLSTLSNATTCMTVSNGSGGGNGTTMGRSVPSGWDVRWLNSTLHNMSAGEERISTLRISVPNGEAPGDYGFLLSAGSAFGNFSISETIVVRVNGSHNLTFSATDSTSNWLPNVTGIVSFEIHNAGTSEADSIYSISSNSSHCTSSMDASEADGVRLSSQENDSAHVNVHIDADASEGDLCQLTFTAWDEISESTYTYVHDVVVGAAHGLELVDAISIVLTPGSTASGSTIIKNSGTEPIHLRISGNADGLSITTDSNFVEVLSGDTVELTWSTSVAGDTDLVGEQVVALTAETQGGLSTLEFNTTCLLYTSPSPRARG